MRQWRVGSLSMGLIKYDVFSMFMVLIIVFTGLGIYSAGEAGLIDRARTELNSSDFDGRWVCKFFFKKNCFLARVSIVP